jgi:hypothetical protein
VKPDVGYVGDAKCAACHGDISTAYHSHPMGRSAEMVDTASPIEKYDAAANNPLAVGGHQLRITKTPGGVVHRVSAKDASGLPLPEYSLSVSVAIGSGTRGRSYLCVEQGTVWQSPISWYAAESRWDLSPGFDLGTGGRRAITSDCLFCHVNRVEATPQRLNAYREPLFPLQAAIGCERCHGPGALHITERGAGAAAEKVDTSIVNPKHLSPELQAAVCAQCHLQGQERVARRGRDAFEFRPGLPHDLFVTTFVMHPDIADGQKSVGQFEQLARSRCKLPGGGRLLCTSCHDPHAAPAPADRGQFYRNRCNVCHSQKGCTATPATRAARGDSCAECHMPRTGSSNIAHASITDHRILRRPAPAPPGRLPHDAEPLVAFSHGAPAANTPELSRDHGIALARLSSGLPPGSKDLRQVGRLARDRLAASLGVWRGDADAWVAMSLARAACGETQECAAAAARAARLAPTSEAALVAVAAASLEVGRLDEAEVAASALVAMNPRSVEYLVTRAEVYSAQKRLESAEADCRAALNIHPLHPKARLLLGVCLHKRGNPRAGRYEADTAIGLVPQLPQRAGFRDWYERETR